MSRPVAQHGFDDPGTEDADIRSSPLLHVQTAGMGPRKAFRASIIAAAVLASWPAAAADEFIKGVYLSSTELCAQAKSDSLQSVIEGGNVVLSAQGLESIEYNCEFVQVTRAVRSPAWLVQAVCQEPGYLFPDVLTVVQMNPSQIDLVSVKPVDPDAGGGNGGSYFLCEGVTMP